MEEEQNEEIIQQNDSNKPVNEINTNDNLELKKNQDTVKQALDTINSFQNQYLSNEAQNKNIQEINTNIINNENDLNSGNNFNNLNKNNYDEVNIENQNLKRQIIELMSENQNLQNQINAQDSEFSPSHIVDNNNEQNQINYNNRLCNQNYYPN